MCSTREGLLQYVYFIDGGELHGQVLKATRHGRDLDDRNGNGGGNSLRNLEPSTFGSLQPRSAWLVLRGSRSGMNLIFFCLIFDERVALFLILLPLPSELSHRKPATGGTSTAVSTQVRYTVYWLLHVNCT